jgi:DNA-binding response OmpR family regulator
MTILNVEDEPQLAKQIAKALKNAGHEVYTAANGPAGLECAQKERLDMIVLDVNLPGGYDGFEVLRQLRKTGDDTRVLMLTARGEVADRINGLKSGADDYLTKPFSMDELLARIEALGRRQSAPATSQVLQVADVKMDILQRKVTRGSELISLSPREFEVLTFFLKEPGRTFSRDEICERIWQREHEYDTRTVEIFIMRLRKKLDEGRPQPLIETVRGVGYRLNPAA